MKKLKQWDLTAWLESVLVEGYVIGLDLSNRDLSELDFCGYKFKKCNFSGSDMSNAVIRNCGFLNCNLTKTKLDNTKCWENDFSFSTFEEASLIGADKYFVQHGKDAYIHLYELFICENDTGYLPPITSIGNSE